VLTNIIGVFRPGRSVAAALASMDASARSAGQGSPATFYGGSFRKVFYKNSSEKKLEKPRP
jgi:hypothetical protein